MLMGAIVRDGGRCVVAVERSDNMSVDTLVLCVQVLTPARTTLPWDVVPCEQVLTPARTTLPPPPPPPACDVRIASSW